MLPLLHKAPSFLYNSHLLYKFQNTYKQILCIPFHFSSLLQRGCLHQSSPKSPFSSTQTLAPRNPNPFTSISSSNFKRSPRVHQGHHLQPPNSKATPRGASPSQASTSTHGLKPSPSPLDQASIEPIQVSIFTHQDLIYTPYA